MQFQGDRGGKVIQVREEESEAFRAMKRASFRAKSLGTPNPETVNRIMAEKHHEDALVRYRKLLEGLHTIYTSSSRSTSTIAKEARKKIVESYGLEPPSGGVKMQEVAKREMELAISCTKGRGFRQSQVWLPLNMDILHGKECDLRHLLLIEMGLLQREVAGDVPHAESPPWFRGNWRNMVKVIESVYSMQLEGARAKENEKLSGSKLVQVLPVKWKTDEEGNLVEESRRDGKFISYSAGRIADHDLQEKIADDRIFRAGASSADYWMPVEIKLLAETHRFEQKAKESAGQPDEGWIAIPYGASDLGTRSESWKSWEGGVPASLWKSLAGPPRRFGGNRGDSKNED